MNYFDRKEKNRKREIFITQGFIASNNKNENTTLGREGSDYSAALLASFLNADMVVLWKDVPGIMNADPFWYNKAIRLPAMNYREAIELAYYGAKVIHFKTIKPLQNKNILLKVLSFNEPKGEGTVITSGDIRINTPVYILKENQILISISLPDLSFVLEESLSEIYRIFAEKRIRMNMMQNSAVSFSVCCDFDKVRIKRLLEDLRMNYTVLYNENVSLLTIRHYENSSVDELINNRQILMEQRSRSTLQYVYKSK